MRQHFQQILVLLFSGLVALSSQVNAGKFTQPATQFYGLSISNFGVTLLKQGVNRQPLVFEKTTLNTPEFFGDPPGISGNDSPVIFVTLLLNDAEASLLRKDNEDAVQKYGEQLTRQLYIGAAGFDAAKKQLLHSMVATGLTVADNIKKNLSGSHLDKHFRCRSESATDTPDPLAGLEPKQPCIEGFSVVDKLEEFGCFNEPDKAEFYICATRWAFEFRTGIKFDRDMVVMEQDNAAASAMANKVVRDKNLPPKRHFILQATTLAQPYFNSPAGLIGTKPWMGLFARTGGYYQVGTDYGDSLASDFKAQKEQAYLTEFMSDPESGLHHTVQRYFHQSIKQGDIYIAANRIHDEAAVLKRIKILKARNNLGDLLLRVADTREHASLGEFTGLSEEQLMTSLSAANVFINRARQFGVFSLALFLGMLEPALTDDSYVIVVGEQSEWFANAGGKPVSQVLLDIVGNEELLRELHIMYKKMSISIINDAIFDYFLTISGGSRGYNALYPGMGEDYIKEWLTSLAAKVTNVHFVPRSEFNDAQLMAFRTRYTSVRAAAAN